MNDEIMNFVDTTVDDVPDEHKDKAYCLVAALTSLINYIELEEGNQVGFQGINVQSILSAFRCLGISRDAIQDRLYKLVELGVLDRREDDDGRKWYQTIPF